MNAVKLLPDCLVIGYGGVDGRQWGQIAGSGTGRLLALYICMDGWEHLPCTQHALPSVTLLPLPLVTHIPMGVIRASVPSRPPVDRRSG
ncbi:hypothetical protein HETIRDRAFT_106673 [Heterobasidion irregulare TC 32-1]|uniref:Uncharacterized protein n=1 Tax=Heterobasidion irregulare (strain TC 32-1) TaxID=747525 RepID=W4JRH8_HETIT|nr:uncharacterized protein HETIRDRAFT_106673 [Heterobasidion irregulare TC 32-1]ETW76069.1 hypothetical protein HETIRDRAFT_106673 [Heterobasidion irregulare TC 32-1]